MQAFDLADLERFDTVDSRAGVGRLLSFVCEQLNVHVLAATVVFSQAKIDRVGSPHMLLAKLHVSGNDHDVVAWPGFFTLAANCYATVELATDQTTDLRPAQVHRRVELQQRAVGCFKNYGLLQFGGIVLGFGGHEDHRAGCNIHPTVTQVAIVLREQDHAIALKNHGGLVYP